ncbi:hypothetical protein QQS21_010610 [Conoideocrella luteorostrata]|uniref:Zn(2)-C6 fungal-type domain-containing protein n=1 Tax=Conoideocrella luteorostrata TaxID=1105319 RepID=A0AAJ0CEP4_9HYPO|nr:hypothetical protein QQS21_010610 [Conoideocrella luteorostrata]
MAQFSVYRAKPGDGHLVEAPGQACDQCRQRKSKCDRRRPGCGTCAKTMSTCTYFAAPKRRGPRPRNSRPIVRAVLDYAEDNCGQHMVLTRSTTPGGASYADVGDNYFDQMSFPNPDPPDWLTTTAESPSLSDTVTASSASRDSSDPTPTNQYNNEEEPGFDVFLPESASLANLATPPVSLKKTSVQLPPCFFEPYVRLFIDRLYPIFPVLDCHYLLSLVHVDGTIAAPSTTKAEYALLSSLAAATIVQLNIDDFPTVPGLDSCSSDESRRRSSFRGKEVPSSGQFFASQCRQARQEYDFIEESDESTIMTSFFLFAYYGNLDQSRQAWYYLHEAIGFAQSLGLDSPEAYLNLSPNKQQQRCRLFWLLFITERAFAIQHQRQVVLRPSIDFPKVFDSHDPKLIYGFVALAKIFKSIDDGFISQWRHPHQSSEVNFHGKTLASISNGMDLAGILSISEMDETQKLDVLVTQQWLRVLACQIQLRRPASLANLVQSTSESRGIAELSGGRSDQCFIIDTCKSLMQVLSKANRVSLEAHGIGMVSVGQVPIWPSS